MIHTPITVNSIGGVHDVFTKTCANGHIQNQLITPATHVAAKRYLCAVERAYMEGLSPASRRSLALQGGIMTAHEVDAFAQLEYAAAAVAVRRWDEAAKDPTVETPALEHFRPILERVLRQ